MQDKKLEDYSKEELISIIKSIKKQKKFGLVWEDKPEKVATDCKEKLPVLNEDASKAISKAPGQPTNIIIEGDNYHSLSALNYTHAGKIDIIYIDPPYNTGKKDFTYNDKYVDEEDTYRHSKWLSFMSKRLQLAKELLAKDGVIFISIDDNEFANLKILCDEIFGSSGFINNFMWLHGKGKKNKQSRTLQQYTLAYSKVPRDNLNSWSMTKMAQGTFSNPDNDPRGDWFSGSISFSEERSNKKSDKYFEIESPSGIKWKRQWMCTQEEMDEYLKDNKIYFGTAPEYSNTPRIKIFPTDTNELIPDNILDNCGTTRGAQKELDKMIGRKTNEKGKLVPKFDNPKPHELIEYLIKITNKKSDITILDFFAGSGTTGHAVLKLNKDEGGNRQFILCTNNENNIAEEVAYPRIEKVIDGYDKVPGLPANLRYFKTNFIEKEETLDKLRRKLSPACEDMIRIREGVFNKTIDDDLFKVFEENGRIVGVIYDRFELEKYIDQIEELETDKPVHLYVFSYDNSGRLDEVTKTTKHEYESQPIPESVLEIYKKIFKDRRH